MGYRVRRIDSNQNAIVKRFRALGCVVAVTSSIGNGFPDLVVRHNWSTKVLLIEIKDGSKSKSRQKLTPDEEKFHMDWSGCVHIIRSEQDADRLIFTLLGLDISK